MNTSLLQKRAGDQPNEPLISLHVIEAALIASVWSRNYSAAPVRGFGEGLAIDNVMCRNGNESWNASVACRDSARAGEGMIILLTRQYRPHTAETITETFVIPCDVVEFGCSVIERVARKYTDAD